MVDDGKIAFTPAVELSYLTKQEQQDKISFRVDDLRKYFPRSYSAARIQGHILKLLEADFRKRQRDLSR